MIGDSTHCGRKVLKGGYMDNSDISPRINPGASLPHDRAFLLRWRLPLKHQVACLVLHRLHRHWLSASPAVASQSWSASGTWFLFLAKEREGTVNNGNVRAFTRGNDLPRNAQTRFDCQGTRTSIPALSSFWMNSHRLNSFPRTGGSAPCIPRAEAQGLTARG